MGPILYLLLNIGVTASAAGLIVLLARAGLGRRLPAWARYALWGLVLLRLLLPFSLPSEASLLNPVSRFVLPIASWPVGQSELTMMNSIRLISGPSSATAGPIPYPVHFKTEALGALFGTLGTVWLAGAIAMALGAAALYALAARRLGRARAMDDGGLMAECAAQVGLKRQVGLYVSGEIPSPVAFGMLRPCVAVPESMVNDCETLRLVLLHELAHIRRGDTLRPLLFLLVCAHWYNPLMWLFYLLSGRDMELACDEAAIRRLDGPARSKYAGALLKLAAERQPWPAAAFGSGEVKARILRIVSRRRATAAAAILSGLFLLLLAAALLTNPAAW